MPPPGAIRTTDSKHGSRVTTGPGPRLALRTSSLVVLSALLIGAIVVVAVSLASASTQTAPRTSGPPGERVRGADSSAEGSSFVSRVNLICRAINGLIVGLPRETAPSGTFLPAAYFYDTRMILKLAPGWADGLAAVHPPLWAASRYAMLLHVNNEQSALLAADLIAESHGQATLVRSIDRRYAPLVTLYNRLADSLGLSVCAQNPTPSSSTNPPRSS